MQFTQQLATLLGAGQPLDRALQILLDLPESNGSADACSSACAIPCAAARRCREALEQQHGMFSRLYVNMVRAGETGGSLDDTLQRLADYLERSRRCASSVINAMIYPSILVAWCSAPDAACWSTWCRSSCRCSRT